jgi:proteic killer suppression protein
LPACTDGVKCVSFIVILNFADKTTEDIFNGLESKSARRVPQSVWTVAERKLDMLNAAAYVRDLKVPPANRLKALKGKWSGYHSIRINDQYRIVFQWIDGNVKNVQITDYH